MGQNFKNGSRDPDHAKKGVVCHSNTWHILPAYKIWPEHAPFRDDSLPAG